nr:FUSC family protein [Desulfobacula sp.]
MLGLAVPVAAGFMTGQPESGMVASLGGLALSGEGRGETFHEQLPSLIYALAAGFLAMLAGSVLATYDLQSYGIPVMAAAAALIGSISKPMARATTQFIIFTIISTNISRGESHTIGVAILFLLGGAWTAGLFLVLRPLFRAVFSASVPTDTKSAQYTMKQYFRRWRRTLTHLQGWHYTFRITLCLGAAEVFDWLWSSHHGYWVAVTVVIVVQRDLQAALPRAIHRAAGTTLGVMLISLLMLWEPSNWAVIAVIAAVAALRPILIETNYLIYAAIQTPLVILLLEFGQESSWVIVIDRLTATFAGCGLALVLGYIGWSRLFKTSA